MPLRALACRPRAAPSRAPTPARPRLCLLRRRAVAADQRPPSALAQPAAPFAARAAPSMSSVASRSAAVATSGSGCCAAASDRFFGRGLCSERHGSPVFVPPRSIGPDPGPGHVKFVADAKDMESDEALRALYERWCKAYGEERDQDEMHLRFNKFKESVFSVDRCNKEAIRNGKSERFVISRFADGKLWELMAPKGKFIFDDVPPDVHISGGFGPYRLA